MAKWMYSERHKGEKVYINLDAVAIFERGAADAATTVKMINGDTLNIKAEPADIWNALREDEPRL